MAYVYHNIPILLNQAMFKQAPNFEKLQLDYAGYGKDSSLFLATP
jgi:hypothetical protein